MYHNGAVLLSVLADIFQIEALGHLEVELNCAALPGSAYAVLQMEVNFGTVERAVALVYLVFEPELVKRRLKR